MPQGDEEMADLKTKTRSTIDAAASTAKRTSDKVIDKTRAAAHAAGKTMVKQGRKLQSI